jgi:hypothetical protein
MRTTLTLDPDVARRLRKLHRERDVPFTTLVNEALRRGLANLEEPTAEPGPYRVEAWDLGRCHLPDLDDVVAVLAFGERDAFRGSW